MTIVRQVSWTKRCWPSQSACCIITRTVHPGLDIYSWQQSHNIGLVSWIQSCHLFSFGHYASSAWCIMRYTVYPGLVSCPFYAIPIYPFKFMKFFIYLSPFIFLLHLAVRVIERNNNFLCSLQHLRTSSRPLSVCPYISYVSHFGPAETPALRANVSRLI